MSDKMTDHDLNSLYHQGATEQQSNQAMHWISAF